MTGLAIDLVAWGLSALYIVAMGASFVVIKARGDDDVLAHFLAMFWPVTAACALVYRTVTTLFLLGTRLVRRPASSLVGAAGAASRTYRDANCAACGRSLKE